MRAQANLPALAVALLVLTATVGVSFALVDGAYQSADRDPADRRVAFALAERLVSAESEVTSRANVVNATRMSTLTAPQLDSAYPVAKGEAVRIRLGDETIVERGDPTGGATVRRVVLVERRQSVSIPFRGETLTLPRRSPRATIVLDPAPGTRITTVRANERVVLHAPNGLAGEFEIDLSRYETTTLRVEHVGPLTPGAATVTYYPSQTTKSELVVTVDA